MPTLQINDITLYYEEHGAGAPVVFLHGLGSSALDWEHQLPVLRERVSGADLRLPRARALGPDRAGPYSPGRFLQPTLPLCSVRSARSGACCRAVARWGGGVPTGARCSVAGPVARHREQRAGVYRSDDGRPARLFERLRIVRLLGMRAMGAVLSRKLFPNPEHAHLRKTFRARFAQNDRRAYLDSLRALVGWSITVRLGEIACPTLIVTSDHDYTPVAAKEAYAARIAPARLEVIPDAHHAVPVERPEAFNAAVLDFLDRVDKETGPR